MLYHKSMGGVDTHDYMRMSGYLMQDTYHVRKWYKAVFLGLLDIAFTNSYILWKMAKPGSDMTKLDYYYSIAEGLITYEGFRLIGQQVATRTASPATPRDWQMTKEPQTITLFNTVNHSCEEYLPKKRTRNCCWLDAHGILCQYSYGGSKGKSRECYVCRKLAQRKQRLTQYYCNKCGVAVCHTGKLTFGADGNMMSCWNALHSGKVDLSKTGVAV